MSKMLFDRHFKIFHSRKMSLHTAVCLLFSGNHLELNIEHRTPNNSIPTTAAFPLKGTSEEINCFAYSHKADHSGKIKVRVFIIS